MRIAVFLPNWIGDVVMATPAIHALCTQYSDARFVSVGRPYTAGVLDVLRGSTTSSISSHRSAGSCAGSPVVRPENRLCGVISEHAAPGADGVARPMPPAHRLRARWPPLAAQRSTRTGPGPVARPNSRRARSSTLTTCWPRQRLRAPDRAMRLFTTPADEFAADTVWRSTGLNKCKTVVALNPAPPSARRSIGPSMRGARSLGNSHLAAPAWSSCAGRVSATWLGRLSSAAGGERVWSLSDARLSIGLTKACIRRSHLLVTTDSGPRHFAAAFDKPVVTLFGPTHIAWTETYHEKAVHLQKAVPCGPCQKRVCPLDHRCMTLLTPEDVVIAGETLLARFGPPETARCQLDSGRPKSHRGRTCPWRRRLSRNSADGS